MCSLALARAVGKAVKSLNLERLSPAMGARVSGVDLRTASADLIGSLRTARPRLKR